MAPALFHAPPAKPAKPSVTVKTSPPAAATASLLRSRRNRSGGCRKTRTDNPRHLYSESARNRRIDRAHVQLPLAVTRRRDCQTVSITRQGEVHCERIAARNGHGESRGRSFERRLAELQRRNHRQCQQRRRRKDPRQATRRLGRGSRWYMGDAFLDRQGHITDRLPAAARLLPQTLLDDGPHVRRHAVERRLLREWRGAVPESTRRQTAACP